MDWHVAQHFASREVDPLDGMSRSYDAPEVLAMMKVERVAQFMNRFLQQTQQIIIRREAVKLLPAPVCGYKRTGTADLRLAKNVLENGNLEIHTHNRQETPVLGPREPLHALQDLR